jgi:cytochrome P450
VGERVVDDPVFDLEDATVLFRDDVLADPAPFHAHLRRHAPVWEIPGTKTFLVSTAELVAEAVTRTDDFSSNLLSLVFRGDDGRPVVFDMTQVGPGTHVLATADEPVHTVHRKLLQPAFSPGAVEALTDFVVRLADELLEPLGREGRGDLATQVAEPLPVRVIARMIGIPDGDIPTLAPLVLQSNDLLAGVVDAETMARSATAAMETTAYLTTLLDGWDLVERLEPTICDVLVRACAAEEITTDDAVGILVQLLGAGTETTTGLIGRSVLQLARDPSLQDTVRSRPDLVPNLLEETLRLDGPFQFHYRAATRDTELGGVSIPTGSRVLLMWASANHDPSVVDDPERFDMERAVPRAHFAFGRGIHFCIGAPLARLEARIVLERLLQQSVTFAVDDSRPVALRPSIFLRRFESLPLVVRPR